jgi:hypothetical protein
VASEEYTNDLVKREVFFVCRVTDTYPAAGPWPILTLREAFSWLTAAAKPASNWWAISSHEAPVSANLGLPV